MRFVIGDVIILTQQPEKPAAIEWKALHHNCFGCCKRSSFLRAAFPSDTSLVSSSRLYLEFRALFGASADFGYVRRGVQSVLFRAVSGSFIRPVLLSTHVSSQDQKSVCGLLELLVPATPETLHFTLPCRVRSRLDVSLQGPRSKLQCRDPLWKWIVWFSAPQSRSPTHFCLRWTHHICLLNVVVDLGGAVPFLFDLRLLGSLNSLLINSN